MAFFANFCHCQGLYFRDVWVPLIRTVLHGFSWILFVKCDDPSQKLMGVHGSIHWGKLILAGKIYETFEFYARQIVKCCRTYFAFWLYFSKKDVLPISIAFTRHSSKFFSHQSTS